METSLGYFIDPLFSVFLGVIFFKERLHRWQWFPIILAASGVIYMTLTYGRLTWIALGLALSFGLYGLVKKLLHYHEAFSHFQLVGFGMVWMALIFFVMEGYLHSKRITQTAN